jgi:PLP dependent protein
MGVSRSWMIGSLCFVTSSLSFRTSPSSCFWKKRLLCPLLPASRRAMASMSQDPPTTRELTNVAQNYLEVLAKIQALNPQVRLVAVSKTKPIEFIQAAYDAGCRCFGENYVQELVEKAPALPKDISWHFIGTLQSKKTKLLVTSVGGGAGGPPLTVETVTSIKLANKLQQFVAVANDHPDQRQQQSIIVFVQINTSNEESKGGITSVEEAIEVCRHIHDACPNLRLQGLMTIGAIGDLSCFTTLHTYKTAVESAIPDVGVLELSMGMSGDYAEAIQAGSTNVRVGSTIFGARDYTTSQ